MQSRALLIQLSDQLSNADREALHFYIGPYVTRTNREDCTSTGTLHLFEILFDRCIVSEDDVDYLIRVFERIRCNDAAEKLKSLCATQVTII
jgi:Death effector domain